QGDVVVAVAEVIWLIAPDVHGQLQGVGITRKSQVDVECRLELQLAARLVAECLVEPDRAFRVEHAYAGVNKSPGHVAERYRRRIEQTLIRALSGLEQPPSAPGEEQYAGLRPDHRRARPRYGADRAPWRARPRARVHLRRGAASGRDG